MINNILHGDCLELMQAIPDKSIDMILCDLPYGTTACKWDVIIPFEPLWKAYERIIKDNGAIALTASQPFTSALVMSNTKIFKYCWYWNKTSVTGFANAKRQPLRNMEEVCIFYKKSAAYNPQGLVKLNAIKKNGKSVGGDTLRGDTLLSANKGSLRTEGKEYFQEFTNYPKQTIVFNREVGLHPTQKPVALFEYLIKTYTNEGDLILDNCSGSGTTAIACINTKRNYIGMEKELKYVELSRNRVENHTKIVDTIGN